ncbi:MAG: DUF4367 domain-containing protein [Clostridia bacterium]|nr:DUF4367 domain-containing protein [Clostridia bacterium]
MEQEKLTEAEIRVCILSIDDKIEKELAKPDADMSVVESYFKQIRDLRGNTHKKDEAELKADLQNIYAQAAQRKKKLRFWQYSSVGRRVASILLVIGLVSVFSVSVYAAREPIAQCLSRAYDKYVELFFDLSDIEKSPSTIETVYTLGLVPEGYELDSQSFEKESSVFVWTNQDGNFIKFKQFTLGTMLTLDHEETNLVSFNIDNFSILFKEKHGKKTYIWNTNEYQFRLYIAGDDISTEDGIALIRSVMKYK